MPLEDLFFEIILFLMTHKFYVIMYIVIQKHGRYTCAVSISLENCRENNR